MALFPVVTSLITPVLSNTAGGSASAPASSLQAETTAFLAVASGTYNAAEQTAIDNLFINLKTGLTHATSPYSGFDFLAAHNLANSADALRYMNAPSTLMTNVSATAHAAAEGFTGDGSADYINTNYNPTDDGTQYALDSASIAVWVRAVGSSAASDYFAGVNDGGVRTSVRRQSDGSAWDCRGPNSAATTLTATTLSQNATGLLGVNRSGSAARQTYRNGVEESNDTETSTSLPAIDLFLFALNSSGSPAAYSDGQISLSFAGRSFTANEWVDIHAAFDAFILEYANAYLGYTYTNIEAANYELQADGTGWDDAFRGDVDQLISGLKFGTINATNTYPGFDRLLLMDTPNEADSLRYLNAPTLTATNVSATAFTATEGFTGDGVADRIDTGYDASVDGSQWVQDSASLFVWVRTADATNSGLTGSYDVTARGYIEVSASSYQARGPNTGNTVTYFGSLAATSTGLLSLNRSGSAAVENYHNGSLVGTGTASSTSVTVGDMSVLAITNLTYSSGQASMWGAGRSFTANEWADIHAAFNTYRTAREAA